MRFTNVVIGMKLYMLLIDWHVQTILLSRFNVFITPQKQQISHTYKNT